MADSTFAPDGFSIERTLGIGGTARVYLARCLQDNRYYALKTIRDSSSENLSQFRSLAQREISLIGGLKYPGLVQLFEYQDDKFHPYLSMQYCPGRTLDNLPQITSINNLLGLLSSISINLYYLQLCGLYHGDLKPQNIFLAGEGTQFESDQPAFTKISDFSLAQKSGEDDSARLGVGTVGYMAPETIDSKKLDHRSDIFAVGVIAYKLTTGEHPFMKDESDPVRINAAVRESIPSPPANVNSAIPAPLSDLIMAMLEKDPDNRPENGFMICEQLESMGCLYPFRKAIRPKYLFPLFDAENAGALLKNDYFEIDETAIKQIIEFSGDDNTRLRNILEIYFTRGLLVWDNGRLKITVPAEKLFLPKKLLQKDRYDFHALPYSLKKKIILTAITGGRRQAESIGLLIPGTSDDNIIGPLIRYASENISEKIQRKFAGIMAERALMNYKNYRIASPLYLKTGNLEKAYTTTLDASNELINENDYERAFELLAQLELLCRQKNDLKKLRAVLMQKADTEKMIGETVRAEKSYREIIALYKGIPHDKLLAEAHKDLGDLYRMKHDFEAGLNALHDAEKIYTELDDRLELSRTLNNIGNILALLGRFDESLLNYRKALNIQHRLEVWPAVAATLNNMGGVFFFQGRYSRTLGLFEIALKLQREIGNAGEIARTLNNLGCVYQETTQYDQALGCLNESLGYNRKIGSKRELMINLDNLTAVMFAAGRLKESVHYIKEAINLADELSDKPMLAVFNYHLAMVQKRMGYYGQALQSFSKSIACFSEVNDFAHESVCLAEMADLYSRFNNPDKASPILQKLLSMAEGKNDKKIMAIYHIQTAMIKNDIDAALTALQLAREINSIESINVIKLRLAHVLYEKNDVSKAYDVLKDLSDIHADDKSNIENANYLLLMGRCALITGNYNGARDRFEMAYKQASASSLRPEMSDAMSGIARLDILKKDYEKGYRNYRQAIKIVRTIADDIADEGLKKSYLSGEKIVSMADEIKKLSRILAQKKRTGV